MNPPGTTHEQPVRGQGAPTPCSPPQDLKPWPIFDVSVIGFPTYPFTAPSRGKALAEAFSSYTECRHGVTMREFMGMCRVRRRSEPLPEDGYSYVRRAYGVDPVVGQLVRLRDEGDRWNGKVGVVVYPNRTSTSMVHVAFADLSHSLIVHPSNVDLIPPEAARATGPASPHSSNGTDPGMNQTPTQQEKP